jgi:hypothetical protein
MEIDALADKPASNMYNTARIARGPNNVGTYRLYLGELDKV